MKIVTERLLIRSAIMSDAEMINAGIAESIDELRKYMPWAENIPTIDETRNNLSIYGNKDDRGEERYSTADL